MGVNIDAARAVAATRPISTALPEYVEAMADEIERLQCFRDEAISALNFSAYWLDEYEDILGMDNGQSTSAKSLIAMETCKK